MNEAPSTQRLPAWFPLILAVLVAVAAAAAILLLDAREDAASDADAALARIESSAESILGLKWRAISGRLPVGVASTRTTAEQTGLSDRIDALVALRQGDEHALEVQRAATHFVAAIEEGYRLLARGDAAGLTEHEARNLDPAYARLNAAIDGARTELARQREQLDTVGTIGSATAVALGTLLAGLLAWRFERSRRAAFVRAGEQHGLARGEARYRSLLANASDLLTILNADGTVRFNGPAIRRVLGYAPEELIGADVFTFIHPDDAPAARARFAELLADPSAKPNLEFRFRARDGSWQWLEASGTNRLADSDVRGIVVNSRDVSDRRRADEEMRAMEARFQTLVEQTPAMVYASQLEDTTSFTYVSPRVEDILGYTPEQLVATPGFLAERTHPNDFVRVMREIERTDRTGEPYRAEFRLRAADGRWVWVQDEAELVRDEAGAPLHWQGIIIDISEIKRAEAAKRESDALFRTAFQHAPVGMAVLDADGRWLRVNDALCALSGYRREELRALAFLDLVHPDDLARATGTLRRLLAGEIDSARLELRCHCKDGDPTWMRLSLAVVRDEHGAPMHLVAQAEDVTVRRQAEAALREAKEAAEEANRLKSQFLSTISHELRTPMNAIVGYAHVLLEGMAGPLTPDQAGDVRQIANGADRLLALINDVLDLSRIEAGRMRLRPEAIPLAAALDDVRADVAPLAGAKGIALAVEAAPGVPDVWADPDRLRQILLNLVGNAVKFTDAGGVRVSAAERDGMVEIAVADTGIGISAEALPHIFDEFRQADASPTRRHGGTGLGLTITHNLVALQGGDLRVVSEPGVGSTFTVRLPIEPGDREEPPGEPLEAGAGSRPERPAL